jgi:SAM-dependent methyltransferase
MLRLYDELAPWWPLVSAPEDYADEAAFFLPLLSEITSREEPTLLELGSGGGNNATHMKGAFKSVTLVDLSPKMLAVSRQLNPDCEHLEGDMRTLRLNRQFDAVFIHDAIDYMTTLDALREAVQTAFIHCKPGGMAMFVPDHIRETFEESSDHGGESAESRAVRYLEWSYDPDPSDTTVITDYVIALREGDQPIRVIHDQHVFGLFGRDEWLNLLAEVGFRPGFIIDPFDRYVFMGRRL